MGPSKKLIKALVVAVLAVMGVFAGLSTAAMSSGVAQASPNAANRAADTCPAPFTSGYTCTFQPATVTKKSHTKIVVKKTVIERVRQFESVRNVRVAINNRPNGVASYKGCVDPVAKGWIKPGGYFSNTGGRTVWRFTDKWKGGVLICNPHRVVIDGVVWMQGDKSNCDNKSIRIKLSGNYKFPKYVPVVTFTSVRSFESTYERWATSTSTTTYACVAGWNLTYLGGVGWCFIATQIPTPSPTTTVVVTTTTTTTTTPPPTTTAPAPKSDVDLCTNIPGTQTAVPAFYKKDGPPGTPGVCYYVGP